MFQAFRTGQRFNDILTVECARHERVAKLAPHNIRRLILLLYVTVDLSRNDNRIWAGNKCVSGYRSGHVGE